MPKSYNEAQAVLIYDMYAYALETFISGNVSHVKSIQKKDEMLLLDEE